MDAPTLICCKRGSCRWQKPPEKKRPTVHMTEAAHASPNVRQIPLNPGTYTRSLALPARKSSKNRSTKSTYQESIRLLGFVLRTQTGRLPAPSVCRCSKPAIFRTARQHPGLAAIWGAATPGKSPNLAAGPAILNMLLSSRHNNTFTCLRSHMNGAVHNVTPWGILLKYLARKPICPYFLTVRPLHCCCATVL